MTCRCDGCGKQFVTNVYSNTCGHKCYIDLAEKEYAKMTDNEKIRLQVLIDQKDGAIEDLNRRLEVYRNVHREFVVFNEKLREENKLLRDGLDRSVAGHTQTDNDLVRVVVKNEHLQKENEKLQGALNNEIKHHAAKLDELDKLKADYENLKDHYSSLEKAYCKLSDKLQSIKRTVEFL
jgi:chromosome segregation ATPase